MPHDGQEETDQEKINRHMVQMETEQGRKDMAKELIQQRRVIRQNSQLYTNMLEHFEKAKGVAKAGATVLKQVQGMQCTAVGPPAIDGSGYHTQQEMQRHMVKTKQKFYRRRT